MILKKVKFLTLAILILLASNSSMAFALPEGATIVSGDASLDYSTPNALTINTSSDKLIIEYSAFSIAANEAVYFIQPSATSAVLNRVTGNNISDIYGILTANGIVYLVNPNGINIGADAKINAAGFIASTLNISNANFISSNYVFSKFVDKVGKSIINKGYIKIRENGQVCLLGSAVANSGTIEASLGSVVLAAGEAITLNLDTAGMVSVVIDEAVKEEIIGPDGQKLNSAVDNSGKIYANGGKVILTTKVLNNIFDYSVNNSGVIQANSIVNHDGIIELVAEGAPVINTGTIEAGQVTINAKNTGYTNIGKVKADGTVELPAGGKILIEAGTILQQGLISANALEDAIAGEVVIESETSTTLDTGSATEAKALGLNGQGGRVLINSGGNTVVNKNALIDVSAGAISGNAGFIDISAFAQLGFFGILNGRAPPGYKPTTAILDPFDATIGNLDSLDPDWGATFNANTTIWATNNITIVGNINIGDGFVLNLYADHNSETAGDWEDGVGLITRNGDFTITGTNATLNLKAGNGIGTSDFPIKTNISNLSAEINPNSSGDIYISQGTSDLTLGSITTPSGTVNISAEGAILDGNADLNNISATNLILSAATGIASADTLETSVSYLAAQITSLEATGNIDIKNDINLTLSDMSGWGYAIKNAGTGDITITVYSESANLTVNNDVITNAGNINLASYGSSSAYISIASPVKVNSGSGWIKLEASNTIIDNTSIDGGDLYDNSQYRAEIHIDNTEVLTQDGYIYLRAANDITRNISAGSINYYEDSSSTYAYIDVENSEIKSTSGSITLESSNTITTNINKGISPASEIYEYYDYSYNDAEVWVRSASGQTVSTGTDIDIAAANSIVKDINVDHIGNYDGSYYGGYYDYSGNYAYLDIEDTLDTSSSSGLITLTASNTINNTVKASDYISTYYWEYWDYDSNYAEIYISGPDAFYSDSGDITLTAKNNITQLVETGYIDYFYADPYNEAYVELYNPIYSQSGNLKLEANNIVDTDITASKPLYDGGINYYEDYYTYSYAYVYISDIISTKGSITLTSANTYSSDITADYIGTVDNEPYQKAYLYIYGTLTTNQIYERDDMGNILRYEGGGVILYDTASNGQINLSATNDLTVNLTAQKNIDVYDDYTYADAYMYIGNSELRSDSGNITLESNNILTANIGAYNDYSQDTAQIYAYSPITSQWGRINLTADELRIGSNIIAENGDILLENNSKGKIFFSGDIILSGWLVDEFDYLSLRKVLDNIDPSGSSGTWTIRIPGDIYNDESVNISNGVIVELMGETTINGDVVIAPGGTLNLKGYNLYVEGYNGLSNEGTLKLVGYEDLYDPNNLSGSTVEYSAILDDGDIYIRDWDYSNAIIKINGDTGFFILDADLNCTGLNIAAGTLEQGVYAINVGSSGINMSGGYFSGGTADITDAGSFSLNGSQTIFTSTSAKFSVAGDWSNYWDTAGTGEGFNHNFGEVVFNGQAGQTITSNGQAFYNLTIENSSSAGISFADRLICDTLTDITLGSTLYFSPVAEESPHTVLNLLTLTGATGDSMIKLYPLYAETTWFFSPPADTTVDWVKVNYSSADKIINANNSGGYNNSNWNILSSADITAPDTLTALYSSTHTIGVWSNANGVIVSWDPATDADGPSDIAGYSYEWSVLNDTVPDKVFEVGSDITTASTTLNDGSYYFHIRTKDVAENWSEVAHFGPFNIDTTPPTITADYRNGTEGNNGWWVSNVEVHFAASDATSGVSNSDLGIISTNGEGTSLTIDTSSITATDLAGNTTTEILDPNGYLTTYNIDTTQPIINDPVLSGTKGNNDWYISDVSVTLEGSASVSGIASIEYSLDGSNWNPYSSSFNINNQGANDLYTRITNNAGVQNTYSPQTTIKIDTIAPVITAGTPTGTTGNNDWWTSDVTVPFIVTDSGSGFDGGDTIELDPKTTLDEGTNLTVTSDTISDLAGNPAKIVTAGPFKVDKTDPVIDDISMTGKIGDNNWYVSSINATLSGSDNVSDLNRIEYSLDSGDTWQTYEETSGEITTGVILDTEGDNQSIQYRAIDNAGRSSEIKTQDFKIDTIAPTITDGTPTGTTGNNGWWTSDVTVPFTATDSGSGFEGSINTIDLTSKTTSGEGTDLTVTSDTISDLAGNTAEAVTTGPFKVDTTEPEINITSPEDGTTYATSQTLEYTVSDNLDVSPDITGPESGKTYDIDGTYIIDINATDLAGNTASKSLVFGISKPAGTNTTLESQLANSNVFNPLPLDLMNIITQHMGSFNTGGVFFYHPLGTGETIIFQGMESGEGENKDK